ncbi:FkbM family methyltransferase [Croceicoccus gelatinilyticus]|uniref:FkbM family methyltransferase n=1 Tax=Croceicoccus gelatinilyticus TaxID=2835536 RepID=UPI001BCF6D20|nr:discoidin domain-containing protein [Croceicoccus gelatinilyticus]MBS7671191.1 FkbM family methyltransferase [Croceicoccus gelatinilyticus]
MVNFAKRFGVTDALLAASDDRPTASETSPVLPAMTVAEAVSFMVAKPCGRKLIRIGREGDGGYLVPDDLDGIEACFSPGTNNYKYFEDTLAQEYGIRSYMCDYSSSIDKFHTPLIPEMQFFEKKWLDLAADDDNLDINEWVSANSSAKSDLMLQIDIEGAEFRNILHASDETLSRFRIVVIEIHGLHYLSDPGFLNRVFAPFVRKLERRFVCVHAHPNNCCGVNVHSGMAVPNVIELTLLRKDRVLPSDEPLQIPHDLDIVNIDRRPPIELNGVWLEHADREASADHMLMMRLKWLEERVTDLIAENATHKQTSALHGFMLQNVAACANLAIGQPTTQSGESDGEVTKGEYRGCRQGGAGITTPKQKNPWWVVDLQELKALEGLVIYNRCDDTPAAARGLRALGSIDGLKWQPLGRHKGKTAFGGSRVFKGNGPLLLQTGGKLARYVKLVGEGDTRLDLEDVEIFGAAPV